MARDVSLSVDVRCAITYLRANLHRAVPMAELAAQAGVSERTLRDHFQKFIGVSPSSCGLRLRLNAAHDELQQRSNSKAIADIALRHGFFHLGRFSRQYRLAFGETPSATRRVATGSSGTPSSAGPAPRGDRPEVQVGPVTAPPGLADLAGWLADRIAGALPNEARVRRLPPASPPGRQRDPNVRYRIEGRLIAANHRLQIVVGLVDLATGTQLWGDAWSGLVADPFPVIERVANAAADAVLPNIRNAESERVLELRPQDMDAYQLCLRAYPLLAGNTTPNARHALDLLHRAIERDPDYALANALAGWAYAELVLQHGSTSLAEDRTQALLFSTRAGMLDQDDALVLTARSVVHTMADDRDYAGELVTRAVARNPRLGWAWERSGWLRAYAGDIAGATGCFGRALRLDPATPAKATLGISAGFFSRARYDLSARWMHRALVIEPGGTWINRTLAVAHARLGEHSLAVQSVEALRRHHPDIRVGDVVAAMHFPPDFVSRVANGLSDLGLPP